MGTKITLANNSHKTSNSDASSSFTCKAVPCSQYNLLFRRRLTNNSTHIHQRQLLPVYSLLELYDMQIACQSPICPKMYYSGTLSANPSRRLWCAGRSTSYKIKHHSKTKQHICEVEREGTVNNNRSHTVHQRLFHYSVTQG
jgi:hypothetical protein